MDTSDILTIILFLILFLGRWWSARRRTVYMVIRVVSLINTQLSFWKDKLGETVFITIILPRIVCAFYNKRHSWCVIGYYQNDIEIRNTCNCMLSKSWMMEWSKLDNNIASIYISLHKVSIKPMLIPPGVYRNKIGTEGKYWTKWAYSGPISVHVFLFKVRHVSVKQRLLPKGNNKDKITIKMSTQARYQ